MTYASQGKMVVGVLISFECLRFLGFKKFVQGTIVLLVYALGPRIWQFGKEGGLLILQQCKSLHKLVLKSKPSSFLTFSCHCHESFELVVGCCKCA